MMTPTKPDSNDAILFPEKDAKRLFILYYLQGQNPHPQFFLFSHPSPDIRIVVERIKRHCQLMNMRFVNVRPAIVDLDQAETKQYGE